MLGFAVRPSQPRHTRRGNCHTLSTTRSISEPRDLLSLRRHGLSRRPLVRDSGQARYGANHAVSGFPCDKSRTLGSSTKIYRMARVRNKYNDLTQKIGQEKLS